MNCCQLDNKPVTGLRDGCVLFKSGRWLRWAGNRNKHSIREISRQEITTVGRMAINFP